MVRMSALFAQWRGYALGRSVCLSPVWALTRNLICGMQRRMQIGGSSDCLSHVIRSSDQDQGDDSEINAGCLVSIER